MTFAFGHDIHAMMNAVNQINVSVAGRAEHDFGAPGQSFRRMRGQIVFAKIGLDLDNFSDALHAAGVMNEPFPQQSLRDDNGVAVVKWARQWLHGGQTAKFPV